MNITIFGRVYHVSNVRKSGGELTCDAQYNFKGHVLDVKNPTTLQILAEKARRIELERRLIQPIVCLCGSTKFKQAFIDENKRLTREGYIVLSVGFFGHHEKVYPDPIIKNALDSLHKRKIDLCDWVWVIDVGGYVGESTRSEIEYAQSLGKKVRYLSQEFPDYVEPVDPLEAEVERLREILQEAAHALDEYEKAETIDTVSDELYQQMRQAIGFEDVAVDVPSRKDGAT